MRERERERESEREHGGRFALHCSPISPPGAAPSSLQSAPVHFGKGHRCVRLSGCVVAFPHIQHFRSIQFSATAIIKGNNGEQRRNKFSSQKFHNPFYPFYGRRTLSNRPTNRSDIAKAEVERALEEPFAMSCFLLYTQYVL